MNRFNIHLYRYSSSCDFELTHVGDFMVTYPFDLIEHDGKLYSRDPNYLYRNPPCYDVNYTEINPISLDTIM